MDIMYTLGKLTGKATKAVVNLTGSTIGSSARGFRDAFKAETQKIVTPEQPEQPAQPVQAEFDFMQEEGN